MDFPIVVLLSGRGSNMVNLADHARHFSIAAVISNKPEAPGLAAAEQRGIPAIAVPRTAYSNIADQKREIFRAAQQFNPKLVVLAGYLQIVEPYFIEGFKGQIINIHPALLPKFPGLDTHRRAIDGRESEHGCTVHYVDSGMDTGPVIAQASVPVRADDTEHDLAERVLTREHAMYPWVVNNIALGKISLNGRQVQYASGIREEAAQLGFRIP